MFGGELRLTSDTDISVGTDTGTEKKQPEIQAGREADKQIDSPWRI
jgi:hypothetical protein